MKRSSIYRQAAEEALVTHDGLSFLRAHGLFDQFDDLFTEDDTLWHTAEEYCLALCFAAAIAGSEEHEAGIYRRAAELSFTESRGYAYLFMNNRLDRRFDVYMSGWFSSPNHQSDIALAMLFMAAIVEAGDA